MARIRTIKPSFWTHEDMSELPEATILLAAALLNYADDEGYFNANPKLVKAECCPLREPSVSIQDSLKQLEKIGWIRLGASEDGKNYGHIVNFLEHQVINRPTASKIKDMPIVWGVSVKTHTQLHEPSPPEGKGKEEERKGRGSAERPPRKDKTKLGNDWTLPAEWREWAIKNRPDLDAERTALAFKLYWTSLDCPKPMKIDWQRTWQRWVLDQKANHGPVNNGDIAPKLDQGKVFRDMAGLVAKGIRSTRITISQSDITRMVTEQLVTEEQAKAYGWIRPGEVVKLVGAA